MRPPVAYATYAWIENSPRVVAGVEEGWRQIASTGAHTLSIPTAATTTTETGPGAVLSLLSEYRRSVKEGSMIRAEFDKLRDILLEPSRDPHSESTSVMVSPPSSQTAPIIHMEPSVPSSLSARCTARPANPLEVCIDYSPQFPGNLTRTSSRSQRAGSADLMDTRTVSNYARVYIPPPLSRSTVLLLTSYQCEYCNAQQGSLRTPCRRLPPYVCARC